MTETIKTYAGSNHPVKDCFLTLELLIDDVDTADTDEPYDVDGAVTSLNIVIATLESQEKEAKRLQSELTNYMLGFATQTEERERLEAENERLHAELSGCEAEARRYAEFYPPFSDGRNTFVLLADWIKARAALNIQQRASE